MYKTSKRKFGEYIRKAREAKGISREELAQKLFVSDAAVWKWENGKRIPDFETLGNLSTELGVSMQDIYDHSKEEVSGFKVVEIVSIILLIGMMAGAIIVGLTHIQKNEDVNETLGVGDDVSTGCHIKSVECKALNGNVGHIDFEYNSQGMLTKRMRIYGDIINQELFLYDEQGRLSKINEQQLVEGTMEHDVVYTYVYDNPEYTAIVTASEAGETVSSYGIKEEDGHLIRYSIFDESGNVVRDERYNWISLDEQAFYFCVLSPYIMNYKIVTEGDVVTFEEGYVQDANGRIIKYVGEVNNPSLDVIYKYDEKGRVIGFDQSEIIYTNDGCTVTGMNGDSKYVWKKVTNGDDIIGVKEFDTTGKCIGYTEFDKNYREIKDELYDDQGNIIHSSYTIYDENGDIKEKGGRTSDGSTSKIVYNNVTIKDSEGKSIIHQQIMSGDYSTSFTIDGFYPKDVRKYITVLDDSISSFNASIVERYENGLIKSYKEDDLTYTIVYEAD